MKSGAVSDIDTVAGRVRTRGHGEGRGDLFEWPAFRRYGAVVYDQALPLATRKLTITTSRLGSDAGLTGAAVLGAATTLGPGLAQLLTQP